MAKRLPELLTEARESAGLSQSGAARKLKVTQPAVSNWESGKSVPPLARLRQIAAKYKADPEPLIAAWMRSLSERPVRGDAA